MDKIKVIIADDSDFVRDGMKIILDVDDDFEVLGCAANGREAIEIAENTKPDVFLMDIQMPEMDGIEATKNIRQLTDSAKASIPIIAVTANAREKDRIIALNAGMDGFVEKPIFPEKLFETMQKIFGQKDDPEEQ